MNPNGGVSTTISDGIATIEFYHPQSNSLPGAVLGELANHITEQGRNDEAKVIVVKSSGERAFCAGASFDELVAIDNIDEGKVFFSGFAKVINACRTCPKIIIGRVQGKTVGGGVGVASSMDYCFATENASIKLSELAVGIGPFVVGPAVERKVGLSAFNELALDASEWRSANWAHSKGLFHDLASDISDLDSKVSAFARKLSKYNPEALSEMKKVFWEGTEHWGELLVERAAVSGRLVLSNFTRNAIAKFKAAVEAKRK